MTGTPLLTALLAFLIVAAAAQLSRTCPSGVNPQGQESCRVLIVGGGPGGLFSAYLLKDLGPDVCVVEKGAVWDGRMQDFPGPAPTNGEDPTVFGTCGLRINEAQTDLRCLASTLNVTLEESNFDTVFNTRGTWSRSMQGFLGDAQTDSVFKLAAAANFTSEDLETELYEYALVTSSSTNPLTGAVVEPHPSTRCAEYVSVREYLVDVLGDEGAAFLMAGNSFKADWVVPLDVCGYIEFFKADWDRCCTNFYPRGGWSAIYAKLRSELKAAGVRMYTNSEVKCLYRTMVPGGAGKPSTRKYVALRDNRTGWTADRLIINAGPTDVKALGGALGSQLANTTEINSITPIEVVVYNAFYPTRWWEKYGSKAGRAFRVVTDVHCSVRSEFPNHPYVLNANATRPVYVDDPRCVAEWKALYAAGGLPAVRAHVQDVMAQVFPDEDVPLPIDDLFYVRKNSWHYVSPFATGNGVSVDSIVEWAKAPFGDPTLCMVGEPYSIRGSGWAHGAWESAVSCLTTPSWINMTASLAGSIDYIESGCNGATSFPNEVFAADTPLDGKLPGQQAPAVEPAGVQSQADAASLRGVAKLAGSRKSAADNSAAKRAGAAGDAQRQRFRP